MQKVRKVSIRRGHRSAAPQAKWEDWISPEPAVQDLNGDPDSLHEAIAQLAYSYWEQRGRRHGSGPRSARHIFRGRTVHRDTDAIHARPSGGIGRPDEESIGAGLHFLGLHLRPPDSPFCIGRR